MSVIVGGSWERYHVLVKIQSIQTDWFDRTKDQLLTMEREKRDKRWSKAISIWFWSSNHSGRKPVANVFFFLDFISIAGDGGGIGCTSRLWMNERRRSLQFTAVFSSRYGSNNRRAFLCSYDEQINLPTSSSLFSVHNHFSFSLASSKIKPSDWSRWLSKSCTYIHRFQPIT